MLENHHFKKYLLVYLTKEKKIFSKNIQNFENFYDFHNSDIKSTYRNEIVNCQMLSFFFHFCFEKFFFAKEFHFSFS